MRRFFSGVKFARLCERAIARCGQGQALPLQFFVTFMSNELSSTDPRIRHGYAQVGDVRLHYAESGDAARPLVLLLHGFPEFWYSWRHQLTALGEHFHVVAPDLRGYNLSDKPARVADY